MQKKYKIEIDDDDDYGMSKLIQELESGVQIPHLDLDAYTEDGGRISVFESAGNILSSIFGEDNVDVDEEEDTVGGEITVYVTDIVLQGEKLSSFVRSLKSANEVEFTSFNDGHTEIGLIYTDLRIKKVFDYES